ncbi:hypothetical protein CLRAG_20350 [Clostridium ragsdalei P11]|uniref:Uncharacterized protein n=1 Tax=Clostridium ragsdalei P11 TaxID=1353534 RepID=A0A1A6AT95_9CLOT|nr:hypothetical protein CLRAG_20350 [Clostridium ragsdalei P11]
MKWEDVRKQYPNTFVKFEIVESHIEEDKEIVDEVAFIKPIKDGKEAMREHLKCKIGQYVYSTVKNRVDIQCIEKLEEKKVDFDNLDNKILEKLMSDKSIFSKSLRGKYPKLEVYKMTEKMNFYMQNQ